MVNWPKNVVKIKFKTCPYNKNQRDALISQIYFGIELYMFRTGLLSIIRSLVPYTKQHVFVMQVILNVEDKNKPTKCTN